MAKKKTTKKSNLFAPILRGIGWLWRLIARAIGSSVRFIFRSSKELDPAHQRDGIAFFLFILALVSAAGVWFDLDNQVGRATYSLFFGGSITTTTEINPSSPKILRSFNELSVISPTLWPSTYT